MTLNELYQAIGGDYEQALKVLRIEKLIDKHIQKLPNNTIFGALVAAGETMDAVALFENAHAIKGVCSNLGLVNIAAVASEIAEEFRPGSSRTLTDEQVAEKVQSLDGMFQTAVKEIQAYAQSAQ